MDRLPVADDVYSMPYDDAFLLGWNTAADQLRGFYSTGTDHYLCSVRVAYCLEFLKGFYAALSFCLDVSYEVVSVKAPRGYAAFTTTYKRVNLDHPRA